MASALQHIASTRKLDASGSTVIATITLGNEADGGFARKARLAVDIPGLDRQQVQAVADEAHQVCPYSKATRGNIEVEVVAVSKQEKANE